MSQDVAFSACNSALTAGAFGDASGYGSVSALPEGEFSDYADRASLLVIGGSADEEERWSGLARAAGGRLLDCVPLEQAAMRLAVTVDVDAMLLLCRGDEPGLDRLIVRLDALALNAGTKLLVRARLEGLDRLYGLVAAPGAMLLCEGDDSELALALCGALASQRRLIHLHDHGRSEPEGDRLERLTDELGRLARTIEALVQDRAPVLPMTQRREGVGAMFSSPRADYAPPQPENGIDPWPIDAAQVRALLRARRMRDPLFPPDLFADPAWDIMLDLLAAHLEGRFVSVSSLCIAAAVPPTTALRWIRQLTDRELLERREDPEDGRRIFIVLSEPGLLAMRRWFAASRGHLQDAVG